MKPFGIVLVIYPNIYQLKLYKNEKHIVFDRCDPGNRMDLRIFCLPCWRGPYSHPFNNRCYRYPFRDYPQGLVRRVAGLIGADWLIT